MTPTEVSKLNLNIGFELETINRSPEDLAPHFKAMKLPIFIGTKYGILDSWNLQTDGSLEDWRHCEIASPINPSVKDILKVLELLKTQGCATNHRCGMHVHVSHPTKPIRITLPRVVVWDTRDRYAPKKNQRDIDRAGVAQRSDNWIEVRLFNATLSPNAVLKRIRLVKNCVRIITPNMPNKEFENYWDTIIYKYKGGNTTPHPRSIRNAIW